MRRRRILQRTHRVDENKFVCTFRVQTFCTSPSLSVLPSKEVRPCRIYIFPVKNFSELLTECLFEETHLQSVEHLSAIVSSLR